MNIFNKILLCIMLILSGGVSIINSSVNNVVAWPQASVLATIKNIATQKFLPYPYASLKQDPVSGMYVLIASPSNYTFFDVPNNYVDAHGGPVHIGATYDSRGNVQNIIEGDQLTSLLAQYGLAIDDMGNQYLGACNQQPLMLLSLADRALRPGQSGKSMICSNNPTFPSIGITSPISYKNSKFYFYYNNLMQTYFVMQVAGNLISYINLSHGYVYNLDGSSRIIGNIVGTLANQSQKDFFLAYVNPQGSLQCIMQYNGIDNIYSDFTNSTPVNNYSYATTNYKAPAATKSIVTGVNAPYNTVAIDQTIPSTIVDSILNFTTPTKYNVYWNLKKPTSYTANPSYQWQCLQRLPIDIISGALLQITDNESYNKLALILKNNIICGVIFAGQFFTTTQLSANSYQLNSLPSPIILSIEIDRKTSVQYVCITTKDATYNYQYSFLTLPAKELQNYQSNVWLIKEQKSALGNVVLVKNLPLNASGYVQLSAISIKNILNAPTDSIAKNILDASIKLIAQDVINNRFLTMISVPSQQQSYLYNNNNNTSQKVYVDLATGILFDSHGIITNNTLPLENLNVLLQQLSLNVVYDNNNKAFLSYATNPSAQNSMLNSISSSSPSIDTSSTNLKLSALSDQNIQLQSDITKSQDILNNLKNSPHNQNITHEIMINKNRIAKNNIQINQNNSQIATLQVSITPTT